MKKLLTIKLSNAALHGLFLVQERRTKWIPPEWNSKGKKVVAPITYVTNMAMCSRWSEKK